MYQRLTTCILGALALTAMAAEPVNYKAFGAKGDGKTDDFAAIIAAHDYANEHQLPVKIEGKDTYYIGGANKRAVIKTDVDFGEATFIIDDVNLENVRSSLFLVPASKPSFKVTGVTSLKRNQANIGVTFDTDCLVTANDKDTRRYIRYGANQNNGSPQTDIFIVAKDGTVNEKTPIIWDFDRISSIIAQPIDDTPLFIRGGHFITIANQQESNYNYHARNFNIRRSRVIVEGLEHLVKGELDHGAPYGGFLSMNNCAFCIVRNSMLTGHKIYQTIGSAGVKVSMGSYDLNCNLALNCEFINCRQSNSVHDTSCWGVIGSNFSKNLKYDGCELSRFDAHQGVANATILKSTMGHQGINAIGTGTFLIEDSKICGRALINLRSDYGSFWEGEFIIRNTTYKPYNGRPMRPCLFTGSNNGQHDFGYVCHMPRRIVLQNVIIDDTAMIGNPNYKGPVIFDTFNSKRVNDEYKDKYPYHVTEEVVLENVKVLSGKPLRISDNEYMFKDVKIIRRDDF